VSDRRTRFNLVFRVVAGVMAAAGLVLLFVPGVAHGLGRPDEATPWALTRQSPRTPVRPNLLEGAGLTVTSTQWRKNRAIWANLSASQRRELTAQLEQLQATDDAERKHLVKRYESFRKLSAAERESFRRQAAALVRFEASLSTEDLAELASHPGKSRAKHLVKLWRASRGLD
jgi:Protein of unknown function (DUF3106)